MEDTREFARIIEELVSREERTWRSLVNLSLKFFRKESDRVEEEVELGSVGGGFVRGGFQMRTKVDEVVDYRRI